jgi:peroxiredoxin
MLFLLLLSVSVNTCLAAESPVSVANDFDLPDLGGERHRLSSYRGKVVLVNFWAVWCTPCRKEIPSLNRAQAAFEDENIVLLAVNVGDEPEAIEEFSKAYPMNFTVLMDISAAVSQQWQVNVFPMTFIIDPAGRIVNRIVGGQAWDQKAMQDSLRSYSSK